MPKITTQKDQHANTIIDAHCGSCKRSTKHKILTDIELEGRDERDDTLTYAWSDKYQIVQCQGCETVMFRQTHMNSEDIEHFEEPDGWREEYTVYENYYPNPQKTRAGLPDDHLLPENIQRIYNETLNTLNENNPILAGIGIRAIIETICKEKLAAGRTLCDKINRLVYQGTLTKEDAEILHKIRTLGNDAAHEVKPHSKHQLTLAFDVVEHLLQGVYILPHHAKRQLK